MILRLFLKKLETVLDFVLMSSIQAEIEVGLSIEMEQVEQNFQLDLETLNRNLAP